MGAPKYTISASPMNLSSVPPLRNTTSTMRARYSLSSATTCGLSIRSAMVVKPRMSENSSVTSRCWPVSAPGPSSAMRRATCGEK